jgi:hypothetical protein
MELPKIGNTCSKLYRGENLTREEIARICGSRVELDDGVAKTLKFGSKRETRYIINIAYLDIARIATDHFEDERSDEIQARLELRKGTLIN